MCLRTHTPEECILLQLATVPPQPLQPPLPFFVLFLAKTKQNKTISFLVSQSKKSRAFLLSVRLFYVFSSIQSDTYWPIPFMEEIPSKTNHGCMRTDVCVCVCVCSSIGTNTPPRGDDSEQVVRAKKGALWLFFLFFFFAQQGTFTQS